MQGCLKDAGVGHKFVTSSIGKIKQLFHNISVTRRFENTQFTMIMEDLNAKVRSSNTQNIPSREHFGRGEGRNGIKLFKKRKYVVYEQVLPKTPSMEMDM